MDKEKINKLRTIFLKNNEIVSEIEETFGNYDNNGELIKGSIPTITTEFCETGSHNDIIYFTFVVYSDSYNKKLFELLKDFSNFQIYGFKKFSETLYPKEDFNLGEFEKEIQKEKFFQINFDYSTDKNTEILYNSYVEIKNKILESGIKVVNQLEVDLCK